MSLTNCFKKAGDLLPAEDKAAILARARTYRDDGQSNDKASKAALDQQIAELEAAEIAAAEAVKANDEVEKKVPQTETEAFKKWFGESKVVDATGKPLVMYHGTSHDTAFASFKVGARGAWFTSDQEVASDYALENDNKGLKYNPESRKYDEVNNSSRVVPVYLKIENPYSLTIDDKSRVNVTNYAKAQRELFAEIKAKGFDGVMWNGNLNKEWVVLADPAQIKSAIGNNGNFDPQAKDITKSADRAPWYSGLAQAIEGVPDRLANQSGTQWALWLKANAAKLGVKQDEIEWSGINEFLQLRGKDKTSRENIVGFLAENGVKVEEVVLGAQDNTEALNAWLDETSQAAFSTPFNKLKRADQTYLRGRAAREFISADSNTKYRKYTLPGGQNYREVLLTLPETPIDKTPSGAAAIKISAQMRLTDSDAEYDRLKAERAKLSALAKTEVGASYKSSHWDQKNVVAHIRVDDRVDADGSKVLFVEELQSDFGQDYKKAKTAISKAVDDDFKGIVERMKAAGVLTVVCD